MPDDSIGKIVKVSLAVCVVCAVLVSAAAVSLNGIQLKNQQLDKIKNILIAGDLYQKGQDIGKTYDEKVTPVMLELETGSVLSEDQFTGDLNIRDFDINAMSKSSEYGKDISGNDPIQVKRVPKYMVIYQVKSGEALDKIILPIFGKGLWSTLYGFVALGSDLKTIRGLTFYDHKETPGLGGEVDNPRWKEQWKGKEAFGDDWNVVISVLKGKVNAGSPQAIHQVDGLSGATLTTRGVDYLVKYWLGEDGYGPYLSKLRAGGQHG